MTRIVKVIDSLRVPVQDMKRVAARYQGIVIRVMINVIDVRIAQEADIEVPKGETLNLAGSWTGAIGPEISPGKISFTFGFGTDYAVFVHEIPAPPDKSPKGRSARHKFPTKWKFLEDPQNRHQGEVARDIKIEIDRILLEVGT